MRRLTCDVAVIGSGPGGSDCANALAAAGKSVILIDTGELASKAPAHGGTCLHVGCIPSKALLSLTEKYQLLTGQKIPGVPLLQLLPDLEVINNHKNSVVSKLTQGHEGQLKRNKVKTLIGFARFETANSLEVITDQGKKKCTAEHIVVATGSFPSSLPNVPTNHNDVLDSTSFLSMKSLPARGLVIGAGAIGLEAASIWSRLGVEVTVVEALPRALPQLDADVYARVKKDIFSSFKKVLVDTKVLGVEESRSGLSVKFQNNSSEPKGEDNSQRDHEESDLTVEIFDQILVSVGRRARTENLQLEKAEVATNDRGFINIDERGATNIKNIWAIGDVAQVSGADNPMLAHRASEDARVVVAAILDKPAVFNRALIPGVIYTQPEIATVGLNTDRAKQEHSQSSIVATKSNFAANGRSVASGHPEGVAKIVYDKDSKAILGCQVIGHCAGELTQIVQTAIEFGGTIDDLASMTASHPGYGEIITQAARAAN